MQSYRTNAFNLDNLNNLGPIGSNTGQMDHIRQINQLQQQLSQFDNKPVVTGPNPANLFGAVPDVGNGAKQKK